MTSTSTAFALGGLGGNNAHGAGFLAAAQELQRQRGQAAHPEQSGDGIVGAANADADAPRRRARLGILPELEFISCTSGAIASVVTYLKGEDVREATERGIAAVDAVNLMPRNALADTWRPFGIMLFTGVPGVFGPWAQAFARHLAERVAGFVNPKGPYYGAVPTTIDEFADLWLPARAFVPERPQEFFDEAARVLADTDHAHGVGVAFNSFDPKTGIEQLYVNAAGLAQIKKHYDENADYGRAHGHTIYQPVTPDAVRNALWLFFYGFPADKLGPDRYVDGAYARSIILNELTAAERIYAVKPVNDRWLGRLPQNQFEVSDMQTEFWMEASYREQYRLIETINDLQAAGRLQDPAPAPQSDGHGKTAGAAQGAAMADRRLQRVKAKKYTRLDLIPVEIAMQRGYFTYFVENREVFQDAYGQSLRLLLEHGEDDAHRPPDRAAILVSA
jgi:hypothetical protein